MYLLTYFFQAEADQSGFSKKLSVLTTSPGAALIFVGTWLPLKGDLDVI